MDYQKIYTERYFNGENSFFYSLGYGRFQSFYFKNLYCVIEPYTRTIKQGKVLDVGCAYGFMLQKFPGTFEKFGIDVSEHAISEAKKRLPRAILQVAGAEDKIPFPEHSFDIVICNDVIEHLSEPRKALQNVFRVLKHDGVFFLNTPNLNWLRKKFFAYADKKEHHISMMRHRELYRLLQEVGFNIIDHWTYTSLSFFFFTKFHSNIGHESAFICTK